MLSWTAAATSAATPTISVATSTVVDTVGTPTTPIVPVLSSDVMSVSISPNITTKVGLAFDTSRGTISGTPTAGKSATYTLTAVNAAGKKATASIVVTVNDIPPTISVPKSSLSFLVGAVIAPIVPVLGSSVISVAISPDITSTGLSFNANTGKISGTPTSAELSTSYTLTASNSTGQTASAQLYLGLNLVVAATAPPASTAAGCEYTLNIADFQSTNSGVVAQRVFAGAVEIFAGTDGFYHVPLTTSTYQPTIVDKNGTATVLNGGTLPVGVWEVNRNGTSFTAGNSGHQNDSGLSGYVSYNVAATLNCALTAVKNVKGSDGYEDEADGIDVIGNAGNDQYTVSANNIFAESSTTTAADLYTGTFTPAPLATAPGAPAITSVTTGEGTATVSFSPPASDGNSPITSYTVISDPGDLQQSGTSSPIVLSGLTGGISYTFTIAATNAVGSGPESLPSASEIPTGVPSAPTISAVTTGNGYALVDVLPPFDDGGLPITGYVVTCSPGNLTGSASASPVTVDGLTDGQPYSCVASAENADGAGAASVSSSPVTPTGVPGAPTITNVVAGNGSATVSFTPPASDGGLTITGYTVTSGSGLTAYGSGSPITINGLTSGVSYIFTVTATNAAGTGGSSPYSIPVTPTGVPGAPTVTNVVTGPEEVTLSFQPPSANGGLPISSYAVTYSPGGITLSGIASPFSVGGLTNGTLYTFTVTATNSAGTSAPSAPAFGEPVGVPGTPTITSVLAGDGYAEVTFDATDNGGATIFSSVVTAYPGGITQTGYGSFPVFVSGLTNGVSYSFTVVVFNAVGASEPSGLSAAVTPTGVPGAPTITNVVAGNSSATVYFNPTSNGGLPITNYSVYGYGATPIPVATAQGSSSPITIYGLTSGYTYYFTVTATNSAGTSAPSQASSSGTTPTGVPSAPTVVDVSASDGAATVTFAPPASSGGLPITSYTVTSAPGGLTATGSALSLTVSGLTDGTAYTFTVTASNSNGSGPPSAPSVSVTPIGPPSGLTITSVTPGDGMVTVAFTTPNPDGSPIQSYECVAAPGGPFVVGSSSPLVISGLTDGVAVTVTCTATNAAGTSAPSQPSPNPVLPVGPPGAPVITQVTAGDGTVAVSFAPPVSNGSPITGYTVISFPDGLAQSGTSSPIVVSGLTNGVVYSFTVTVTNAFGTGPASQPSDLVMPTGVPSAPEITHVTNVGAGNAAFSLLAPASNGGLPIVEYLVTCSPGNLTGSAPTSPVFVSGLIDGQAYSCVAFAANAEGFGPASVSASTFTPTEAPGAPAITNVVAGSGNATVSFLPPASNGGLPITSYTVVTAPGGQVATGSTSPIVVSGLTNGVSYTFTVTASNATGTGPSSASSSVVTPTGVPGVPTIISVSAGDSFANVFFSIPSNNGLSILDYTATSSPGGITGTGTSSPVKVTGLTNGQAYTFTVTARNSVGSSAASAASASVTPIGAPSAPVITSVIPGDSRVTVSFTTPKSTGGSPIISYTVSSPGNPGLFVTGSASPIVVSGLTNGQSYSFIVVAANATATSSGSAVSASVIPSGVPLTPIITSTVAGPRQVTVFFSPQSSEGSPISSFTVSATPGGSTQIGASSPIVMTGLTNGVPYTFTILATNANGSSPAGASSTFTIPTDVPGAPTITNVVAGNGSATVSFSAPSTNNGLPVTSYTATSSPGGITASGAGSPITVTGLTSGQSYTFTVTASNGDGSSVASAPSVSVTPVGPPSTPGITSVTAGNGKVTVAFTPSSSNGGSPIQSYTCAASPGGQSASGSSSPLVITGLTNGVAVTVTCTASNAHSTSGPSSPSSSITPGTVPGAPTIASVIGGSGSALVFFAPPASNGGFIITSYTVTSTPGGISISNAQGPIVVSGLSNGQSYTFVVTATNALGTGPASLPSASVVPASVPDAPIIDNILPADSSAVVTFHSGFNGGEPISSFTVIAGNVRQTATGSPYTFTGLTNGAQYTFTVVASNGAGDSAPSSGVTITAGAVPVGFPVIITTTFVAQLSGQFIDVATGNIYNSDGSEGDLNDNLVLPAPSPLPIVDSFDVNNFYLLTLDPDSFLYCTSWFTNVDLSSYTEYSNVDFSVVNSPVYQQIYIVTTSFTLVDPANFGVQLDPATLRPVGGSQWAALPTPMQFRVESGSFF